MLKQKLKNNVFVAGVYYGIKEVYGKVWMAIAPKKRIEHLYAKKFGVLPNLENPNTFNEKLNWLKLYWRDPIITDCIDKYRVRKIIEDRCGAELLTKLYGVWDDIDEVDFDKLPDEFALKMNNGSGCNVLCKDKKELNFNGLRRMFKKEMKRNYFYTYGEWGYKNIVPKIICEELIHTPDGKPPKDYKIFCFEGKPKFLFVASDRYDYKTKFDFYTTDWKWLPVSNGHPNAGDVLPRPEKLDEMLEIAEKLSKGFPQVRVDLYCEYGKIYFGELTFYHFSAFTPFEPREWDAKFGEYFKLPTENIVKNPRRNR